MNVKTHKFQSLFALVSKLLARRNHRTTLPQSALAGCQLPLRGSLEGAFPAPSLRELSSECETEGVYFDEQKRSKVSEPKGAGS